MTRGLNVAMNKRPNARGLDRLTVSAYLDAAHDRRFARRGTDE